MPSRFTTLAHVLKATGVMRQTPRIIGRSLLPAAALAATISASGPALAADVATIIAKNLDPVVIRVLSDGNTVV